jgi:hypothetical protein
VSKENNMNTEWLYDLASSSETDQISYGFCIPLHGGGFAWLVSTYNDTLIKKSDDGWWYHVELNSLFVKTYKKYLDEIRSGKGNWIISPENDNSDLKWSELDYENASVVKRVSKITHEYEYTAITTDS